VTTPAAPMSLFATIGDSGLKAYGGVLTEEYLPELSGARGRAVYRRMSTNDATIGAILRCFTAMISGVEWSVQAANETPEADEAKVWLEGVLEDMESPLTDVITEACTMFAYGFAPLEVTYKVRRQGGEGAQSLHDDGKIGVHKIALRGQTSLIKWEMDLATGEVLGIHQMGTWKGTVFIPRRKLALFRCDSVKGNPESTSILRNAYRAWFFKSKLEEFEAVGAERNNAGIPRISIPSRYLDPSASPEEKRFLAEMKQLGTRIRRDQEDAIILASDVDAATGRPLIDISLLTPGGKTTDIGAIIERYDRRMATAVLMDWIFLGQGSVGSWALSSDRTSISAQFIGSYLKRMAETLNRDVVRVLWEANKFDPKLRPKLVPADLEKQNLGELISFISGMVSAGAQMFPDPELENRLRKLAGLPPAPDKGAGADLPDQGAPELRGETEEEN
jgi:hypothetical protein